MRSLHAVCSCILANSKLIVLLVTDPTGTERLCIRLIDEQWQQGTPRELAPFCRQSTTILRRKNITLQVYLPGLSPEKRSEVSLFFLFGGIFDSSFPFLVTVRI